MMNGLYTVFKRSLEESTVSTQWKISRMHTIYRKGDASASENYPPRQMLSVPSKLLEAIVCEGLHEFISVTGLLSNKQWGFRAGRSTEGLLIHLTETCKQAVDNRQVVGVVYIDFQEAFDTVSHTILRYKLKAIGITGDLLNWIISYLTNRKQFAIVNGCTSQTKNVCCRVPQGSLLGPRFFSYYVNNLPDAVTEGELAMYADDTNLSVVGDNVEVVSDKLNKALTGINLWYRNNKLTIHTGKSEAAAMILTHKPFCGPLKPVLLGNKVLGFVAETKCLGIIIDNQLSTLKYLTKDTLQSIYFTSIIPTVTYYNSVWGTSSPTLLHEVEHIHARAAKIIYRLSDVRTKKL